MASMLKERKKAKADKDKPEDKDSEEVLDGPPEFGAKDDEPKDDKPKSEDKPKDEPKDDPAGDPMAGGDPVKVFADILEMDDMTAQAVYAEAMSMPDMAEMSPEQMAKKIKGNYQVLKDILTSMGEKAQMAMQDDLNKPMDMPEGPGGPGPGDLGPGDPPPPGLA